MKNTQGQPRKVLRSRPLIAGVLLALFLFVLAMAQFRTLHRFCHAEADRADHQCVVTKLASGQVDAPETATTVVLPPLVVVSEPMPADSFVPAVEYSLLPSRGPPALLT